MAKAEKGDLIRVVETVANTGYKIGDILEVERRFSTDIIGVVTVCGHRLYDHEYEIHRKAGEEDAPPTANYVTEGNDVLVSEPIDAVNSPQHYTQGKFEVIDVIEQFTSGYNDGFTAHCIGTATKYIARAPYKHATPLEDLRKAARYLAFAIEHEQRKVDASK